jgi:hypothetical protein
METSTALVANELSVRGSIHTYSQPIPSLYRKMGVRRYLELAHDGENRPGTTSDGT